MKKSDKTAYYNFGHDVFGPFLLGFVKWLQSSFTHENYQKIFFFARDGYMMEKAYSLLEEAGTPFQYVYFSRNSIRRALLWTCDTYEDVLKYIPEGRFVTLGSILETYGFHKKERERIARQEGFSLETEYLAADLSANEQVKRLYEKYRDTINAQSKLQYENVLRYFEQIGMQGKCAMVDIGWHGNLQYYIEEICRIAKWPIDLSGYYIGINPKRLLKGRVYGYLFSKDNMKLRKSVLCFLGICERLFQSLEGSIGGYELQGESVVPVMNEYEYSEALKEQIRILHDGTLDYIREHKEAELFGKETAQANKVFMRFGKSPSLKQLQLFHDFYNFDGTEVYYLPQKTLFEYGFKEVLHGLSNSTWKTGYMKQLFKLPLPYYWIYYLVRK